MALVKMEKESLESQLKKEEYDAESEEDLYGEIMRTINERKGIYLK